MYRSIHQVLLSGVSPSAIMGSSESEFVVSSAILKYLYRQLDEELYWVATNKAGLHLTKGDNLAADIAIFNRKIAPPRAKNFKYQHLPPQVIIEVDIKADTSDFTTPLEYYRRKSQKLLNFGVQKIVWVNTEAETLMFNDELAPISWNVPIELLPGFSLIVGPWVRDFVR